MSNPPKQKGTGGETELVNELLARGFIAYRTPAGTKYDLAVGKGFGHDQGICALATRPDRGQWLVTITLDDFAHLLEESDRLVAVEVKRYRRFALHTIFEKKFGGKK